MKFSPKNKIAASESDFDEIPAPKILVTMLSTEKLELTVTKTCLEVMQNLLENFTSAVTHGTTSATADVPEFVVKNETGTLVELNLEKSSLEIRGIEKHKTFHVEAGKQVELQNKSGRLSHVDSTYVSSGKFRQGDSLMTCLNITVKVHFF